MADSIKEVYHLLQSSMSMASAFKNVLQGYKSVLLCVLLCFCQSIASGQNTNDDAYCPTTGEVIVLDTISYSANKAMPFDRCFFLKYTFTGDDIVKHFAVTPIDKKGKTDFNKRDYLIFSRTLHEGRAARREFRKDYKFEEFKTTPYSLVFDRITPIKKGKKTIYLLQVPPLDPGREYRITLFAKDHTIADNLMAIGAAIGQLESKTIMPVTSPVTTMQELALQHRLSKVGRSDAFTPETFESLIDLLYQFDLTFDAGKLESTTDRDKIRTDCDAVRGRVFFSKNPISPGGTANADRVNQINNIIKRKETKKKNIKTYSEEYSYPVYPVQGQFSLQISPKIFNDSIIMANGGFRMKTVDDQIIHLDSMQSYYVNVLILDTCTLYKIKNNRALLKKKPASMRIVEIGSLKASRKGGIAFIASPKASLKDGKWIVAGENAMGGFQRINKLIKASDSLTKVISKLKLKKDVLHYIASKAILCPCEDKGIKDLTTKDELLNTLSILADTAMRGKLLNGRISIAEPFKKVETTDYAARIANLDASVVQVNKARDFAGKVQVAFNPATPNLDSLVSSLAQLSNGLKEVSDTLGKIKKRKEQISDVLIEGFNLFSPETPGLASTSMLDMVAEAKLRIVPDFGFVTVFKGDNTLNLQDLSPYLGFNIGFRAIDKNINFRRMLRNKTIWHRLSFSSGITLRSMAIKNKREDFFDKSNLITGLGFRINNWLRLSGGAVWFKAVDPNPLIDDKPLRFSPYAGVSIDLELQDLFGGIKKLLN
jgi:hypothetical protein